MYKISTFYHRVGQDSIIFHTKYFEQKHVLTGSIHFAMETRPTQQKISCEKLIFLIFCAFLRILHVYDLFY